LAGRTSPAIGRQGRAASQDHECLFVGEAYQNWVGAIARIPRTASSGVRRNSKRSYKDLDWQRVINDLAAEIWIVTLMASVPDELRVGIPRHAD
jgi:hypothetical protein